MEIMASFLGVRASGFALDVASGRTNSQARTEGRGVNIIQEDPVATGVYEISGSRPMLCATRRVIYSKTQDLCRVLSSAFEVRYDACLGGGTSNCTDTGVHTPASKLTRAWKIHPARAVTTTALPLNSFPASIEEAPSNLIVVGGFAKCSSSHIFRVLQSHPNTVTFGKQVGSLPGAEIEFEMAAFAIARNLQIPGKPIISACTGLALKSQKECTRLASYVRGSYDNSTAAVLVITDIFFLEKKVLVLSGKLFHSSVKVFLSYSKQALARRWAGKVKLLLVVREPADYLWAAYNFWILPGEPKGLQDDWTDRTRLARSRGLMLSHFMSECSGICFFDAHLFFRLSFGDASLRMLRGSGRGHRSSTVLPAACCDLLRTHARSPELFHDLVVADGKMPNWQPRSNKVTGLWFNLIQDAKNASATTLVLKSEALRELIGMRNLKPSSLRRITHAPVPHIPVSRTPLSQTSKVRRTSNFLFNSSPACGFRSGRRISLTM